MRLRVRPLDLFLAIATLAPFVAGAAVIFGGGGFWAGPTLDEVAALAQARRFAEAQRRCEDYLRRRPGDRDALLVLAELALNRPSPDPRGALERLETIRPDSPALAAWVQVDRGRAFQLLSRWDRSEACWKEALERDASVLESGRRLFDLYELQGRRSEARALGLSQLEREPDPRDRLRTLARLARLDVDPPDPRDAVSALEGAARGDGDDIPSTVAYGLALVHVSRIEPGLATLRRVVERHPNDRAAWNGLLDALDVAGRYPEMADAFAHLPPSLAEDPRFARHQGRVAQEAGRWAEAAEAYRRAWEDDPDPVVGYRFRRALRFAGQIAEADRQDELVADHRDAYKQVRGLLTEINAALTRGGLTPADLCEHMAGLRERMRRPEDARAWRAMAERISRR